MESKDSLLLANTKPNTLGPLLLLTSGVLVQLSNSLVCDQGCHRGTLTNHLCKIITQPQISKLRHDALPLSHCLFKLASYCIHTHSLLDLGHIFAYYQRSHIIAILKSPLHLHINLPILYLFTVLPVILLFFFRGKSLHTIF